MAQPQVLRGLRDAGARGKIEERSLPEIPEHLRNNIREGEKVYVSPNEGLRMTLWVDWGKVSYSTTGKRQPERRDIQFRNGIYRTSDPKEIDHLDKSKSKGVIFFDLAELNHMARSAKIAHAKEILEDPEVIEALKLSKEKSVDMPERKGKKKPAESEEGAAEAAS